MAYRIVTEFKFPTEWSEIERCEFADAGVCRADWFTDETGIDGRTFDDRLSAEEAAEDLRETYKGSDVNGVDVLVMIEEC